MANDRYFIESKKFFDVFEPRGEVITGVSVPGAVQFLGEVSGFNRGKLMAANTDKTAIMLAQKRKEGDRSVHFYSLKYDEKIRMTLNEPQFREEQGWANFMSSTLFMLEATARKAPQAAQTAQKRLTDLDRQDHPPTPCNRSGGRWGACGRASPGQGRTRSGGSRSLPGGTSRRPPGRSGSAGRYRLATRGTPCRRRGSGCPT